VVSITARPLYHREGPGTHITGGWVGPTAVLEVFEKSPPTWIFFGTIVDRFDLFDLSFVRVTNMGQIILLPLPKEGML
jgi:hypothetical protein